MTHICFRGQSGRTYRFMKYPADAAWARQAGIALFCASGPYGWRIVRASELSGRLHDVQPIWAFSEAERYGATTVFVCNEADPQARSLILDDLEAGLSPVFRRPQAPMTLAA